MPRPPRVNRDFLRGLLSGVLGTLAALLIGAYVSGTILPPGGGILKLPPPDLPAKIPPGESPRLDYDRMVRTPAGRPVPLSGFRGQVVFLSFFASWCPPCTAEMPSIQNLYGQLRGIPEVRFLLVTQEDPETVRAFLEKSDYTVPMFLEDGSLARAFGVDAIPETFLLNRKGEVVFRHGGAARWDAEGVDAFIRRLL